MSVYTTARAAVSCFAKFLTPYWFKGIIVLIFLLLVTISSLAPPYIIKIIIDDVLLSKHLDLLITAITILLSIILTNLILSFVPDYLYARISNLVVRDIRIELFQHLIQLPLDFHNRQNTGDLIFRLDNDVERIESFLTSSTLRFLHDTLTLIGLIGVLCWLNFNLFLLSIIVIPFFVANLIYFQPKIKRVIESIQQKWSYIFSYAIERFNNVPLIQLSNSNSHETRHFLSTLNDLITSIMRNVVYSLSMGTISSGLIAVTPVFIMGWGGYQVIQGAMTVGTLIAFLQYTSRLFNPVGGLHDLYMDLVRGLVSMRRVLEFMQLPTQEATHNGHKPFGYQHTIELQDVHFHFADKPVLRGVNLKLIKGKSYALVGMSGSGKTTLANMLCGFYQPYRGRILIDDTPIEDINLYDLREHIGLVSQHVYLFNDTIENNIRYGNFECESTKVEQVIDQVGLNGLDMQAEIGEQGIQLSGGQLQRIVLARTLLQPVDLLILDEATAALDAESEEALFQQIRHLYGDLTILLISHRLSAVQGVDEVICLANGQVVDQGPPEVLRQKQGYYQRFVLHQQEAVQE